MAKIVLRDPLTRNTVMEHTVSEYMFSQETEFQEVDFIKTPDFGTCLVLGGVINVSERDEIGYHEMIAHVPMFAHPNPRRVLIIGGGDGGTMREVVKHPALERATLVEIDELVVEKCKEYLPQTACGFDHEKSHVIIGDGLKFVEEAPTGSFDVILVDSTDPVDAGVALFTPEFYAQCHRVLADDGILVPQSDSMVYYPDRVADIGRSLREIFASVDFYTTLVPTYPGGLWTFAFASKGPHPYANLDPHRFAALQPQLSYYSQALHRAAFVLPVCYERVVNAR